MVRGRPLAPLVLTDDQRDQLTSLSQSTSMPHGSVQRARTYDDERVGRADQPRPAGEAPQRRRVERAPDGGGRERVEEHCAAVVLDVRDQNFKLSSDPFFRIIEKAVEHKPKWVNFERRSYPQRGSLLHAY